LRLLALVHILGQLVNALDDVLGQALGNLGPWSVANGGRRIG
jgi:hypothetical protein